MSADLFVYGTLRDEDLVLRLTGRRFQRLAAVLPDFERIQPANGYPYVLPRRGALVEGLVLLDLDPAALALLDEYEEVGRLYRRIEVRVRCGEQERNCFTYAGIDTPPVPA